MSEPRAKPWFYGPLTSIGLLLAVIVFVLDQVNKWWLLEVYRIAERGRVELTSFLDLTFVMNTGISYGLLSLDSMEGQYFLATIAVLASCAMLVWLARTDSRLAAVALGMVIGGAIANAMDRVTLGGVADFYSLHAYGFYWYIFNLADVAIVVGAALLLYDLWWSSRKNAANHG